MIKRKYIHNWPEIRKHLLATWALPEDSPEREAYFYTHAAPLCAQYSITDTDAFIEFTRLVLNLSTYHRRKKKSRSPRH